MPALATSSAGLSKRQITARNRPIRQEFDQAVLDGRINKAVNWFLHTVLDCCGAHDYTIARRETLARLLGKCLSSIKNYLRAAVAAGFVWIEEETRAIYISALVPPPPIQLSLFDAPVAVEEGKKLAGQGQKVARTLTEVNPESNARVGGDVASAPATATAEDPDRHAAMQPTITNRDPETRTSSAPAAPLDPSAAEKIALLQSAGLTDARTMEELARLPLARIRRAVADVVQSAGKFGGGFVAYLLRNNIELPPRRNDYVARPTIKPAAVEPATVAAVVERLAPGAGACRVIDPGRQPW